MKTISLLATIFMLAVIPLCAAEQTLLEGELEHGGYGALINKFSTFDGEFGNYLGIQAAWVIDHTFVLGLAGYGLTTEHTPSHGHYDLPYGEQREWRMGVGYGGFTMFYVLNSDKLVHPQFELLIGGGTLDMRHSSLSWEEDRNTPEDGFFVMEPGVSAEVNVVNFMRIGCGATYRFVSGVEGWGYTNADVAGPAGFLALKFGKF